MRGRSLLTSLLAGLVALGATQPAKPPSTSDDHHHRHHHHAPTCGCSWSSEGGCGISSRQLYDSLVDSNAAQLCRATDGKGNVSDTEPAYLTNKRAMWWAQFRTIWECKIRQQLDELAPKMKACLGLSAAACTDKSTYERALCEWGAQDAAKCGIDEERLLQSLVGDDLMSHPLVELVVWADQCTEKGKAECSADDKCEWLQGVDHHGHHHSGRCSLDERVIYSGFMKHPGILRIFDHLHESAMCHARYEHTQFCAGRYHCLKEAGVCRANVSSPAQRSMEKLVGIICKNSEKCDEPCEASRDGSHCQAPAKLPSYFSEVEYTQEDAKVEVVFVVLASATALYEVECNELDDKQDQCKKLPPACSHAERPKWGDHHDAAHEDGDHTALGVDGRLGELMRAALQGTSEQSLDEYLKAHPLKVSDIAEDMRSGLASLRERLRAPATTGPETMPVEKAFEEDEDEAELEEAAPWALAGLSIVAAALCVGLAGGAICHRLMQPRHLRTYLLREEAEAYAHFHGSSDRQPLS